MEQDKTQGGKRKGEKTYRTGFTEKLGGKLKANVFDAKPGFHPSLPQQRHAFQRTLTLLCLESLFVNRFDCMPMQTLQQCQSLITHHLTKFCHKPSQQFRAFETIETNSS